MLLSHAIHARKDPGLLTFTSTTNRYIAGPTIDFPAGSYFSIEFDALFRRYRYQTTFPRITDYYRRNVSTGAWEASVLLKHGMRNRAAPVRPYLFSGLSWDRLQGLRATEFRASGIYLENKTTTQNSDAPELVTRNSPGIVIGGGIDLRGRFMQISPEIRYTRWTSRHFAFDPALGSNQNQAEFLLGITFLRGR